MEAEKGREAIRLMLANVVRDASRAGRLMGMEGLLESLKSRGATDVEGPDFPGIDALMDETLASYPEIEALESISGQTLYYVPALLSRTYASILDRKSSPVILMAEEVRRNSADYPRPLPLEIFEESPFDLKPDQIADSLKTMAETPEFHDITFVTTSVGGVYLFSSRFLDRHYAAFLAERADVGLALNP